MMIDPTFLIILGKNAKVPFNFDGYILLSSTLKTENQNFELYKILKFLLIIYLISHFIKLHEFSLDL